MLPPLWSSPVSLINARVWTGSGTSTAIRFGRRVLDVGTDPRSGDIVVDVAGAHVLPGLINGHDHLELNHYGLLKRRERYDNASEWIDDLRPALQDDPEIRRNRSFSLVARLFIGGLKNLLAGATTVAHHNPRYSELGARFPVRVVSRYGWAHSFALEGQPVGARGEPGGSVRERYLATPADTPFIVHAAEGIDAAAAAELARLDSLGCLRENTVLVHGVALTGADWVRMKECGSSLVWCPASNRFLFGRTAPVREFLGGGNGSSANICLGTDSRITGAPDLLEELRCAHGCGVPAPVLLHMVTGSAARVLRLPLAGGLVPGAPADMIVIPPLHADPAEALVRLSRRETQLVVIGGCPMVGDPRLAAVFTARRTAALPIAVDGVERLAQMNLARTIARCPIQEPGVQVLG
jgi:cytosine/adenosine deaminase-related metal-dependent hydrolase